MLFYFMPISAIIFSFAFTGAIATQWWDSLTTAWGVIGGMLGGSLFVFVAVIVGLVWWLILRSTNKKPESTKKEWFKSNAWSYWFIILYVIIASLIRGLGNIPQTEWNTNNESDTIKTVWEEENGWNNNEEKNDSEPKEGWNDTESLIDDVSFKLNDFRTVQWDFWKTFEFDVKLSNTSQEDILAILWYFEVYDMFGDKLWRYNIEKVSDFKAWDTYNDTLKYSIVLFTSVDTKLSKSEFKDLEYKYGIEKIIFKKDWSNENKVQGNHIGQDIGNIDFYIDNKESAQWQYYDSSIKFNVRVVNNGEKNVKGIKWGFYIYDIFGKEVNLYSINITEPIASWATYTKTMEYDINEFMVEDMNIFNMDFEYMKYKFEIDDVIFTE